VKKPEEAQPIRYGLNQHLDGSVSDFYSLLKVLIFSCGKAFI
jgi:hypothetical protein